MKHIIAIQEWKGSDGVTIFIDGELKFATKYEVRKN